MRVDANLRSKRRGRLGSKSFVREDAYMVTPPAQFLHQATIKVEMMSTPVAQSGIK